MGMSKNYSVKATHIQCEGCRQEFIVGITQVCYTCFYEDSKKAFFLKDLRKHAYMALIIFPVSWSVYYFFGVKIQLLSDICLIIGMGINPISIWMAKKF